MTKRQSYQRGTITRVRRKNRPDVWVLRYYEYDLMGERVQRARTIATVEECRTKAAAEKKAQPFRETLNQGSAVVYFRQLATKFRTDGLPGRHCSSQVYRCYAGRMEERWGDERLDWMCAHPAEIERWLKDLNTVGEDPRPLANGTRRRIRAIMHRMFELAMKWGYVALQRNPIDLVELRGLPREYRDVRPHLVLTHNQVDAILADEALPLIVRVLCRLSVWTGLSASEMAGLCVEDVNFERGVICVRRGVVGHEVNETKTPTREKPVPMHESLAEVLRDFMAKHPPVKGWLFGSIETELPFNMRSFQQAYLMPAAGRHGLPYLGWHDFRHTYRALLREGASPLEVQRDLMRHSSVQMTEQYGKAADVGNQLRKANARVVEIFTVASRRA